MAVDADLVAASFGDAWTALAAAGPFSSTAYGATALVTGLPIASLNGVWVHGRSTDVDQITHLLDEVWAHGVPYCLQTRPMYREQMAALAAARGMVDDPAVPLMALADTAGLVAAEIDGLTFRELPEAEHEVHCAVAAAGFGAPLEAFQILMGMLGGLSGLRIYVGEVDGVAVTTALTLPTLGDAVGVFDVATPPEYQRKGYGAAVTVHAVREAGSLGARWAWLQSSEAGFPVYERIGFRTVEDWPAWQTAPA
jgi:GNAT superfamily N-acetyltransferase